MGLKMEAVVKQAAPEQSLIRRLHDIGLSCHLRMMWFFSCHPSLLDRWREQDKGKESHRERKGKEEEEEQRRGLGGQRRWRL